MHVGYIGLGAMGGALARHLIGKYPLSVLDINTAAMAAFVKQGAVAAASAAELARTSDIVLMCLPRSYEVRQVIFGPGGLAEGLSPGKIVIDQTSGVPAETREFAQRLAERRVSLFDAPVSGAMATAVAGSIAIIASGPADALTRALPVLNAISPNVYRCGDRVGNGQTMKSVNNIMNAGCRLATLELVAMGRKMGLSLEAMTEAMNSTSAQFHFDRHVAGDHRRQTVHQVWLALGAEGREPGDRAWGRVRRADAHCQQRSRARADRREHTGCGCPTGRHDRPY